MRIMETKALRLRHRAGTPPARARGARSNWKRAYGAAGMSATHHTAFLTDSTLCIGCKACEVACKEWNGVADDGFNWSGNSYDNTGAVGHSTWRHVKFVEAQPGAGFRRQRRRTSLRGSFPPTSASTAKNAGCLEACPTGAIVRTEFGGVYRAARRLQRLRLLRRGLPVRRGADATRTTAAPSSAPSVTTGRKSDCSPRARRPVRRSRSSSVRWSSCKLIADERMKELHEPRHGRRAASTIRRTPASSGIHALFIVRGDPRQYNLPPNPEVPTIYPERRMEAIRHRLRRHGRWQPHRVCHRGPTKNTRCRRP